MKQSKRLFSAFLSLALAFGLVALPKFSDKTLVLSASAESADLGLTASSYAASSVYEDKAAANAFDGDSTTFWQASGDQAVGDNVWVSASFNGTYALTSAVVSYGSTIPAGTCYLEVTTDGSSWKTAATFTASSEGNTLALSAKATAARLRFTDSSSKNDNAVKYWPEITALELYGTAAGRTDDLNASASSVSATSVNGNNVAAYAVDSDASTYWQPAEDGASLTVVYPSSCTVGRAVLTFNSIYPTGTCVLSTSENGSSWTDVSFAVASASATTVSLSGSAKYVRVTLNGASGDKAYYPELVSFEVYEDGPAEEVNPSETSLQSDYVTQLGKSTTNTYAGKFCSVYTYGGSGFRVNVVGSDLYIYVPQLPEWDGTISIDISVQIDTDMPMEANILTVGSTGWYCVASGMDPNVEHTVTVRKLSRGFYGFMAAQWLAISDVKTSGYLTVPEGRSDLVIEVYGDSISNGDAVLNYNGQPTAYTYGSYSSVVGRLLNADTRVCANTGNGLLGWCAAEANGQLDNLLPPQKAWSVYDPQYSESAWDHTGDNAADAVIINLGTNDRTEFYNGDLTADAFHDEYLRFVKEIKTDCPDAIVVCTIGAMGGVSEFGAAIQRVVSDANSWNGSEFCYWVELAAASSITNGLGYDNGHPSNTAHEIYALQIASLINEKLGLGVDLGNDDLNTRYGASFSASSVNSDKVAANAFDGDSTTFWQPEADNATLTVAYNRTVSVSRAAVTFSENYPTGTCTVSYSNDGVNWYTAATFTASGTGTKSVGFSAVNASYLRLTLSGSSNEKYYPQVTTFAAYA